MTIILHTSITNILSRLCMETPRFYTSDVIGPNVLKWASQICKTIVAHLERLEEFSSIFCAQNLTLYYFLNEVLVLVFYMTSLLLFPFVYENKLSFNFPLISSFFFFFFFSNNLFYIQCNIINIHFRVFYTNYLDYIS